METLCALNPIDNFFVSPDIVFELFRDVSPQEHIPSSESNIFPNIKDIMESSKPKIKK
jgi:hypothetical protein